MYSIAEGLKQFNIHLAKSNSINLTISTSKNLSTTNSDGMTEWYTAFAFLARLSAYTAILALMILIVFLIMKYLMENGDESTSDGGSATEINPLPLGKAMACTYGTCHIDIESGCCNINSSDSDSSSSSSNKISAELYDGKICVICYDEERNCFFVPCGHCATCYICARRILHEENKVCPVCRRFIGKVRKLFA